MNSISDLETFFYENKELIQGNYPGITLKRLKEDCLSYIGTGLYSFGDFFSIESQTKAHKFMESIRLGVPLEYILKRGHFYGRDYFVNEHTLIPRFETELLVEKGIHYLKSIEGQKEIKIIDVGAGSGCILLSLLMGIGFTVSAIGSDISESTLDVARSNYQKLSFSINSSSSVRFVQSDRFENISNEKFDLIVSNPPYIKKTGDDNLVHSQVKEYEPSLALFIEDQDYDRWFESFFEQVIKRLKLGGLFLMEGHENHLDSLKKMLQVKSDGKVSILKDLTNRKRFISLEI